MVQPGPECLPAGLFAVVAAGVGPAFAEGPVEPFDLPVGLRPVGPGPLVSDTEIGAGLRPDAAAVAAAVVRQHPLDGDAAGGEPGHRAAQDSSCGGRELVVVDLGVGQPAVVIDDGVDVGVADFWLAVGVARLAWCRAPVAVTLLPADVSPATAVGDVPELRHVHVDQRSGVVVLVAADRLPGMPVEHRQPVGAGPDQHRVNGRGGQVQPPTDLHRPQPLPPPQRDDPADDRDRRASWAAMRPAGAVDRRRRRDRPVRDQRRRSVTACPAVSRGPGHVHELRRLADGPPLLNDQHAEPATSRRVQSSISVRHEDLLRVRTRHLHRTRRSSHDQSATPTSHQPAGRVHLAGELTLAMSFSGAAPDYRSFS
jgi:hypothetical protein